MVFSGRACVLLTISGSGTGPGVEACCHASPVCVPLSPCEEQLYVVVVFEESKPASVRLCHSMDNRRLGLVESACGWPAAVADSWPVLRSISWLGETTTGCCTKMRLSIGFSAEVERNGLLVFGGLIISDSPIAIHRRATSGTIRGQ